MIRAILCIVAAIVLVVLGATFMVTSTELCLVAFALAFCLICGSVFFYEKHVERQEFIQVTRYRLRANF